MADTNDETTDLDLGEIADLMGIPQDADDGYQNDGSGRPDAKSKVPSKSVTNDKRGSGFDGALLDDEETDSDDSDDDDSDDEGSADSDNVDNTTDDESTDDAEEQSDESDEDDADGEDSDEEENEDEADKQPPAVRKLLKRVDKLTARAKASEERTTELEEQLTKASAITLTPTAKHPLAAINTIEELDRQVQIAEAVQRWAEDNPDGAEVQGEGGAKYYDAAEIRERGRRAREILRQAGSRRDYLDARPGVDAEVRLFYPALSKPGSGEHKAMTELLKAVPELRNLPNAEVLIGDMMAGQQLRFERYQRLQKQGAKSKSDGTEGKSKAKGEQDSTTKLPRTPEVNRSRKIVGNGANKSRAVKRVTDTGDYSREAITGAIEAMLD